MYWGIREFLMFYLPMECFGHCITVKVEIQWVMNIVFCDKTILTKCLIMTALLDYLYR